MRKLFNIKPWKTVVKKRSIGQQSVTILFCIVLVILNIPQLYDPRAGFFIKIVTRVTLLSFALLTLVEIAILINIVIENKKIKREKQENKQLR